MPLTSTARSRIDSIVMQLGNISCFDPLIFLSLFSKVYYSVQYVDVREIHFLGVIQLRSSGIALVIFAGKYQCRMLKKVNFIITA